MKQFLHFLSFMLLVTLFLPSVSYAVTQEEYDTVVRQRDALYQQLIEAGIDPVIKLSSNDQLAPVVGDNETDASEFVYGSDGTQIRINAFIGESTNVVIPQTIDGVPVTMIGEKAFSETNVKSVVIPEGVTYIGPSAFQKCKQLDTVVIPSTLTKISKECFSSCQKLKYVVGFDNITHFDSWAFQWCRAFTGELVFSHDTTLEWGVFDDSGITGVRFLAGKISVAYDAFAETPIKYCYIDSECDFTFAEYSTATKFGAFFDCDKLTTVIIPSTVTSIPDTLLYGCKLATVYTTSGSAAEAFAKAQFISVNTKDYEAKVAEFQR